MATTLKDLQDKADLVYNATKEGENTAERVGGAFQDAAALIGELQDTTTSQGSSITNLKNSISDLQDTDKSQADTMAAIQNTVTSLSKTSAKMVVLTQDEYDALVSAGTVDADTYYNVLEE